jgi:hypothetical protein
MICPTVSVLPQATPRLPFNGRGNLFLWLPARLFFGRRACTGATAARAVCDWSARVGHVWGYCILPAHHARARVTR